MLRSVMQASLRMKAPSAVRGLPINSGRNGSALRSRTGSTKPLRRQGAIMRRNPDLAARTGQRSRKKSLMGQLMREEKEDSERDDEDEVWLNL